MRVAEPSLLVPVLGVNTELPRGFFLAAATMEAAMDVVDTVKLTGKAKVKVVLHVIETQQVS